MKHPYSDEFSVPPALILPAIVRIPRNAKAVREFRAKIDTAADICAVPQSLIEDFRPPEFTKRFVRQTGRLEGTYWVTIELDGNSYDVEALSRSIPYVLIGRDILNELVLVADGPNEVFELQRPTPPQRRRGRGQN